MVWDSTLNYNGGASHGAVISDIIVPESGVIFNVESLVRSEFGFLK